MATDGTFLHGSAEESRKTTDMTNYLVYLFPLLVVFWIYLRRRARAEKAHAERLREATEAGLTEPPSLHPVIDPTACVGSGTCVRACPEHALGIIGGKAQLINPAACIGHGACEAACPVKAITLVFGTERRGMDIPMVKPNFETNVDGLYIAGELGGMGLIRKAAEQGKQAIASIAEMKAREEMLDVLIVGAGPAGLAAGLGAVERRLRYEIIEQETGLGGTIYHYPRNKIAMTAPMKLPVVGRMRFGEVSKEALLEFWEGVVRRAKLRIRFGERVDRVERKDGAFVVGTTAGTYRARAVLLAIGRRGTPRKLGVPGEELPKVVYRLIDAAQYRGQAVLVVGGGDSALEAALACAEQPGTSVVLSYRGEAFSRVKAANRSRLEAAEKGGRVRVLLSSNVLGIEARAVAIEHGGRIEKFANDAVIVNAGGVLPTEMLRAIGVQIETKHGTA
jgi:thioredoxin reductase/NAD-dependent dihydropyrimidine dehydrogenase PreA subunit